MKFVKKGVETKSLEDTASLKESVPELTKSNKCEINVEFPESGEEQQIILTNIEETVKDDQDTETVDHSEDKQPNQEDVFKDETDEQEAEETIERPLKLNYVPEDENYELEASSSKSSSAQAQGQVSN